MTGRQLRLLVKARGGMMEVEAIRGRIRGMPSPPQHLRLRMAPPSPAALRRVDSLKTYVVGQPSMLQLAIGSWARPLAREVWAK